jgi:large subunit ribosomal protein L31
MQEGIHPNYPAARVSSKCHPFYTGTIKLIDTAGRIDRFRKRYEQKKPAAGEAPKAAEPAAEAEKPQG